MYMYIQVSRSFKIICVQDEKNRKFIRKCIKAIFVKLGIVFVAFICIVILNRMERSAVSLSFQRFLY